MQEEPNIIRKGSEMLCFSTKGEAIIRGEGNVNIYNASTTYHEQVIVTNNDISHQSHKNAKLRDGQTRTTGYMRDDITCLGGVSIPV